MPDDDQQTPETGTDWKAEAEKWKSLSRKNEEASKANAEKAKRADDAEKALQALTAERDRISDELTKEKDRLAAELDEANKSSNDLAQQNLRLNIGLDKELPKALIERLKGDDADALSADADALLALIPAAGKNTSPRPDPSQGAKETGKPSAADQFAATVGPLFS